MFFRPELMTKEASTDYPDGDREIPEPHGSASIQIEPGDRGRGI